VIEEICAKVFQGNLGFLPVDEIFKVVSHERLQGTSINPGFVSSFRV
jgi:hypothetical protein